MWMGDMLYRINLGKSAIREDQTYTISAEEATIRVSSIENLVS